jgi:hypothetical protein
MAFRLIRLGGPAPAHQANTDQTRSKDSQRRRLRRRDRRGGRALEEIADTDGARTSRRAGLAARVSGNDLNATHVWRQIAKISEENRRI